MKSVLKELFINLTFENKNSSNIERSEINRKALNFTSLLLTV